MTDRDLLMSDIYIVADAEGSEMVLKLHRYVNCSCKTPVPISSFNTG